MPKLGSYIKSVLTTLVAKCLSKTTNLHPEELPGHAQARWLHQECSNYFGSEMFR